MEVPVVRVHEARGAKHPDNVIDGSVVLADQRKLIDRAEDDRRCALINRVIGEKNGSGTRCGAGGFSRFQSQASLKQTMPMRPAWKG